MPISTVSQKGLDAPLTLTAPNLGTPSAINLSNATALPSAALPVGCILQVVSTSTTSRTATTSTSFVDCTNVTASITPTRSSSKILALVTASGLLRPSNAGESVSIRLVRGSTEIAAQINLMYSASTNFDFVSSSNIVYLDSPATTLSTTYKLQIRSRLGAGTVYLNQDNGQDVSTITLMEVAA